MSQIIGIVGHGTVGRFLDKTFRRAGLGTIIYDKYQTRYKNADRKQIINEKCDLVFIAVPTPTLATGGDLSAVEEAVEWIWRPMCIKSTIVPGTVDRLTVLTGKEIVFSPEYIGETPFHKYRTADPEEVIAIGGNRATALKFLALYREIFGPEPHYFVVDAVTAELAKYMENCFFATKVAFVSQFYLLADEFGADFEQMREIWLADSRIGRSHSTVMKDLGFGGRCLPKDLDAIILASKKRASLLEAVADFNKLIRLASSKP